MKKREKILKEINKYDTPLNEDLYHAASVLSTAARVYLPIKVLERILKSVKKEFELYHDAEKKD